MQVAIFGIGRSGTTSLYKLIQDWMTSVFGTDVDFVYEPFLWDRETFNKPYNDIHGNDWGELSSVSYAGVYHHLDIPLFIDEPSTIDDSHLRFIESLVTPSHGRSNVLMKAIRANGRYQLFSSTAPAMKSLFIIRNPIDVVNSAAGIFSFFGDDYHKSDEGRFFEQLATLYPADYQMLKPRSQVEKEACYWYFMNRYFLEQNHDSRAVYMICHEDFVVNRERVVHGIADHLGIAASDKVVSNSTKKVGPSVRKVNLSEHDFAALMPYMDHYTALLEQYFPQVSYDPQQTLAKYSGNFSAVADPDPFRGKTSSLYPSMS